MGSLSPLFNLPVGSAIGQVSESQPASTNLLFNTFAPQLAPWVLNGTAAFPGLSPNDQWDANFIPAIFSGNAAGDFVDNPSVVVAVITNYSVQAQFSSVGTSTRARFGVNWTGGVPRFDFIDINPKTGQILAVGGGAQNVSVTTFASRNAANQPITVVQVSFTTTGIPVGSTAGDFQLFPALAAASNVFSGGFQVEALVPPTAFIPTPVGGTASRPFATINRLATDRTTPFQVLTVNHTYQPTLENGTGFTITANAVTFTLPGNAIGHAGEWCEIQFTGTTFFTLAVNGAGTIQGPGIAPGTTSIRFPYDGTVPAGGVGPFNVCGIRAVCLNGIDWEFIALTDAHGIQEFVANGTFNARRGMTAVWIDQTAGGGGGGGAAAVNSAAGGGNSGDALKDFIVTAVPGTAYSVTIGAGGNGGTAGNNAGAVGTNTIFGALTTSNGGNPGNGAATATASGSSGGAGPGGGVGGTGILTTFANYGGNGGGNVFASPTRMTQDVNPGGSVAGETGNLYGGGGSGGSSGITTGTAAAGGNGRSGIAVAKW